MALFKRDKSLPRRPGTGVVPNRGQKAAASVSATPRLVEILRAFDGGTGTYGEVYRKLHPVRTCVDFLADSVSTTSLKVYRRAESGRPEVRDHPLAITLRHPNPETSPRALIAGVVRDLGIYANAYWEKVDGTGRMFLVPWPPARVRPRGGGIMGPASYEVWPVNYDSASTKVQPRIVPRERMVHFRFYDPEDRRIGTSKLEALRSILAEEVEASKNREGFWKNAARQDFILATDEDEWQNDRKERFRAEWQAAHSGSEKAGKTAVLFGGMKPFPVSFNAKDSEFLEGRKFILEATARVFNIPVSLLSLTETSTYASQKEFHKQLYQDTLPPWFQLIESEIMLQLLPDFEAALDPDVYVEFNVASKLAGSFEEQATVLNTLVGRPIMTAHEGRNKLNLPPRNDPTDDELAIPTNNIALGVPQPAEPDPAEPVPLRAAASLPPTDNVLKLKRALDREAHILLERFASGEEFDIERWNTKIAALTAVQPKEITA